jgi:hypothetical protein
VPVLGICYGMQAMAEQLGGKVENGHVREFGYAELRARGHTALLKGIADFVTPEGHGMLKVWMSHGDKVLEMPPGFKLMASTDNCPVAGMADEERRMYAVQFHPEVTHTMQGKAILGRFVHEICGCKSDWNMPDYIAEAVEKIRTQVGVRQPDFRLHFLDHKRIPGRRVSWSGQDFPERVGLAELACVRFVRRRNGGQTLQQHAKRAVASRGIAAGLRGCIGLAAHEAAGRNAQATVAYAGNSVLEALEHVFGGFIQHQ